MYTTLQLSIKILLTNKLNHAILDYKAENRKTNNETRKVHEKKKKKTIDCVYIYKATDRFQVISFIQPT